MADAFAFVLHGHLPYARNSGRWPHGEEWLHEAILGTYLPLVSILLDLRDAKLPYRLTIGLTPVLLEQLADKDVIDRFEEYAADQQRRAEEDVRRFADLGDYTLESLATRYVDHVTRILRVFRRTLSRDLVGGFVDLVRSGHVELLTSAATHGYLPLLKRPDAIRAQLANGVASTRRHVGIDPAGIWLPECAYTPGLERYLEEFRLTHFLIDAALLEGRESRATTAEPLVVQRSRRWASGDGSSSAIRYGDAGQADLLSPYLVAESRVAVVARHPRVSGQVWSALHGYPGDGLYREFHRKDEVSGLRYWRVTDSSSGLDQKETYDWDAAFERTNSHASHFVSLVRAELEDHRRATERDGLLVAAFDLELFGHWWFEGVAWLGAALRGFAEEGLATTSLERYLKEQPPRESTHIRRGSWGKGNDDSTWLNDRTAWTWVELERAAARMEGIVGYADRGPLQTRAVAQATRELLIAQASDWQFLITTGQADDYARERFRTHLLRFERCAEIARTGTGADDLATLEYLDNPFPEVDWSAYRTPAGRAVRQS
jgi:1,4-alpha-glucan branching enzyme